MDGWLQVLNVNRPEDAVNRRSVTPVYFLFFFFWWSRGPCVIGGIVGWVWGVSPLALVSMWCRDLPLPKDPPGEMLLPPLAQSQFSGRLDSFWSVPLHVLRTRFSRNVSFLYLLLLVKAMSSRRLFITLSTWFITSCGVIVFSGVSGLMSSCLLHLSFHARNGHSDIDETWTRWLLENHVTWMWGCRKIPYNV